MSESRLMKRHSTASRVRVNGREFGERSSHSREFWISALEHPEHYSRSSAVGAVVGNPVTRSLAKRLIGVVDRALGEGKRWYVSKLFLQYSDIGDEGEAMSGKMVAEWTPDAGTGAIRTVSRGSSYDATHVTARVEITGSNMSESAKLQEVQVFY